tara:strand:+ start:2082 stop:2768 length:687 start_codon:yes stop_codon:yes gene_type:complete
MNNLDRIIIIMPLFNEGEVVQQVLLELKKYFNNIVVIDDGSTDNSNDLLSLEPVTLLRHPVNLGQGAAIATGFEYVKAIDDAFAVITFDADGQHAVEDAKLFAENILSCQEEIIFGSRFLGNEMNIPFLKRYVLRLATFFTNLLTGMKLSDTHNGLKAIKKSCLNKLDLDINGYAFETQLISQISKHEIPYKELPANIIYTDYSLNKGQSLRNGFIIIEDIIQSFRKR